MKLVMCQTSGRIVVSDDVPMFLYKEYAPTLARLLEAGWKIRERFSNVRM